MSNLYLKGKAYYISGSSAGVGFSIAKTLAERGAMVTISGRSSQRGELALNKLRAISDTCFFVAGDANDAASVASNVADAVAYMGRLDGIVSAGAEGVVIPTPFADMTPAQIDCCHERQHA